MDITTKVLVILTGQLNNRRYWLPHEKWHVLAVLVGDYKELGFYNDITELHFGK